MRLIFFCFASLPQLLVGGEQFVIGGNVRDAATGEPLAAANIRVLGTSRGTIANAYGTYALTLDAGSYALVFSSIGYRPDTLQVHLTANLTHDVLLPASDIVLPEIVVTSEDPAFEIIRRAIANKKKWMDRLKSYNMEAFTRQILQRDTAIASITESFTKGTWQQGDTLREAIVQRRQTANVEAQFNYASVGRILNFNDDEIRFLGYSFVGPTAGNALDYYNYRLLRTRASHGREVYDIRMMPRTKTVPLFDGTISIANETYALMGVDVEPNDAFLIPFVKEKELRYRQQFGLYEQTFWMPADIRIDAAFAIGILGFSFPRIVFHQTSVIYDYKINTLIADSVPMRPRLVVDSSATKVDSAYWVSHTVLPLTSEEKKAYETIDSTQTLDVQFRPGGFAFSVGAGSDAASTVLNTLDLSFNRVEGFHLGARAELDTLTPRAAGYACLAYGFSDKRWKYAAGATVYSSSTRRYGIGAEVYRRLDHHPDQNYYGVLFNSFTSLLDKNDYRDYYRSDGWRGFFKAQPVAILALELSFISERQWSVAQQSNFSIVYPSRSYRPNPTITDGRLRSIRFDGHLGKESVPLDFVTNNTFSISLEHSSPSIASSQFNFTRLDAVGTISFPTFARTYLLPPTFRLRIGAGVTSNSTPPQRMFSLESSSSGFAPFGVMRALGVKEFGGTGYISATAEHNFRSLPFLALGLGFLYENNIELIAHGGAARIWNTSAYPLRTTDGWYYEGGFSFNRIFELLRINLTWRTSSPERFKLTFGVANIL
jgi:hypothetical protein